MNSGSFARLLTKAGFELLKFSSEVSDQRAAVVVMALECRAGSVGARQLPAHQRIGSGQLLWGGLQWESAEVIGIVLSHPAPVF